MKKFLSVLLVLAACGDDDGPDLTDPFDAPIQTPDAAVPDSPIQMFDARSPDATPVIFDASLPDALPALEQGCRVVVSGDLASRVLPWHVDIPESRFSEDFTQWEVVQAFYHGRTGKSYLECDMGEDFPANDAGVTETKALVGFSLDALAEHLDERAVPVTFTSQGVMIYQPDPAFQWSTQGPGGSFSLTITSMKKGPVSTDGTYLIDVEATAHGVLTPITANTPGTITMDGVIHLTN